jgi:Protein of unknown function (DUF998)
MSSTINRSPDRIHHEVPGKSPLSRVRRPLLICGIAASLLYGAMIWVISYPGYSPISQTVSELSAWGVSTRSLWMVLGTLYEALMVAFGLGVWAAAEAKRSLRIAGGLLLAYSSLGLVWPFAAMHQREILAAGGETLADTAHLVLAAVTVALMFAAIAFGAAAFGWWFRLYSISTILVLLTFGALTGANASRIAANLPTPWAGLWERINIGVFLLWVVVLALVLLRAQTAPLPGPACSKPAAEHDGRTLRWPR